MLEGWKPRIMGKEWYLSIDTHCLQPSFPNIQCYLIFQRLFSSCQMKPPSDIQKSSPRRGKIAMESRNGGVRGDHVFNISASVQFSHSVTSDCDLMNCSKPGLRVHHQLPEFTQTHVHQVGDAIQPSHPLSSPSSPVPNPSQHQSLFQWVNSSQGWPKYWSCSLSISPSKEHPGLVSAVFKNYWVLMILELIHCTQFDCRQKELLKTFKSNLEPMRRFRIPQNPPPPFLHENLALPSFSVPAALLPGPRSPEPESFLVRSRFHETWNLRCFRSPIEGK